MNKKYLIISILYVCIFFSNIILIQAQQITPSVRKPSMAIIEIDVRNIENFSSTDAGNIVRTEMEVMGVYEIMDRYSLSQFIENKK